MTNPQWARPGSRATLTPWVEIEDLLLDYGWAVATIRSAGRVVLYRVTKSPTKPLGIDHREVMDVYVTRRLDLYSQIYDQPVDAFTVDANTYDGAALVLCELPRIDFEEEDE